MTRKLNISITNHLDALKSYPKSNKFSEEIIFPESILPILEKTSQNIVRGVGDTSNEMLDDINLFSDLLDILKKGKNSSVRFFVANLISQLYVTTNNKIITEELINALVEKDIDDNGVLPLLYAIPKNSEGLHKLGRFLNSKNKNIRGEALRAIVKNKTDEIRPLVEKVLIGPLVTGSEEFIRAIYAISRFGNEDSISVIKPYLYEKNTDSQIFALGAIESIMKEKCADLYIELLSDKRFRSKPNAILAIKEHCGKEGLEVVIKRAKSILSGNRSSVAHHSDGHTELTDCIDYITSFEQEAQVISFYQYIVKKTSKITDIELNYLKVNNEIFYESIT